ncbi:hypothetical protein SDC9_45952 [bioreactor metagenome]|uniref:Uncharacterized protein n=1 Tax=bioreactor metagenome TaxID=1076179 RepID=A0A644W7M0_9ZZZZ
MLTYRNLTTAPSRSSIPMNQQRALHSKLILTGKMIMDHKNEDLEERVAALRHEVESLETKITRLDEGIKQANRNFENNLLRQIEILAVFVIMILLIITNVIGIDVLGSMGLRGIAMIDLSYLVSMFALLLGIKIIVGKK